MLYSYFSGFVIIIFVIIIIIICVLSVKSKTVHMAVTFDTVLY